MVQDTHGRIWRNIADTLKRLFSGIRIVEVPLDFVVSVDGEGKQIIEVYMTLEGEKKQVRNVEELALYGFSLEKDGTRYVLDKESLSTLQSIISLKPEISDEGKIIASVHPAVLKYLRTKRSVSEDVASKNVKVQEESLRHLAEVSYEPSKGIHVKAGYAIPGHDGIVLLTDFDESPDREYAKFEGSFYRIPAEDSRVREWVETQEKDVGLEDIPEFFKRDLVLLKSNFNAVLTEPAEQIKVIEERFQPHIQVDIDERGWLNFDVSYSVGEYKLPYDVLRKPREDYANSDENTWIKLDKETISATGKELEDLGATKTDRGYSVDITKFVSLEDFIKHVGGIREVSAEYQRFLDEITDFSHNSDFKLPAEDENDLTANNITLRPYQREGIHWLNWLTHHHLHGVLADDMGLGKTIQTIAAIRLEYESTMSQSHSLIVCPKSVIGHWHREIQRVYPRINVYDFVGQQRNSEMLQNEEPTIFITTYDILARDIDILETIPFLFVVLDEGTKIKNPDTRRAISAKKLNAAHRIALSGTPIENRPAELWSLFDFVIKGHLGSYGRFISAYERPIQDGDKNAADMLAKRIRPFILRRMKEDVAKDLPEKIEMNYWCELTEEQKALYKQLQDLQVAPVREALQKGETVNYAVSVLPVITKLKQVCDHPALITGEKEPILGRSEKFDTIIEKIGEILEAKESVVLFSHFLGTLDLFEAHLKNNSVLYIRLDGATQNRQELIDKFNAGDASVALCSLMAVGHGINLTAANHVIHVDRWWNPAVEDQATDRVHRIGQTKNVYVYKVLTVGTLEEKIDALLENKRGVSDKVIGAATKGVTGWTREELLEILEPIKD